ncbi:MAG: CBS domain-containing protein [Thermoleophilia bacterium]|nr:CBS domain-containing protein [Thermoleophilia bacterium]
MADSDPLAALVRRVEPLRPDTPVGEAAERICAAGHGLPVVAADGTLAGFVGEAQALGAISPGYLRDLTGSGVFTRDLSALRRRVVQGSLRPVGEVMLTEPAFVDTDDSEMHAAARFLHCDQHDLPVVDAADGRVVGVLRMADLVSDIVAKARARSGSEPTG